MDFDYKKYSLEKLEEWIHDAVSCAEASPQEIYDTIKKVVEENYHIYKNHTERCYELLALLNGNGRGHIEAYDDYLDNRKDYPNPISNKNSDGEVKKEMEDLIDKAEKFYHKASHKLMSYQEAIDAGWEMSADGFWVAPQKENDFYVYSGDEK